VEFVVDDVVIEQVIFHQLGFFPLSHPTHAVCLCSFICHQFVIQILASSPKELLQVKELK
jgi:hypothetical protein